MENEVCIINSIFCNERTFSAVGVTNVILSLLFMIKRINDHYAEVLLGKRVYICEYKSFEMLYSAIIINLYFKGTYNPLETEKSL